MSIMSMGLHCLCRGSVHIGSPDPFASPVIDFDMLSNEVDIDLLISGLNLAKKMIATEPLASLVDGIISPSPECKTPEQIKDFIKKASATTHHPIATVSMLPEEDGGCVNERLKLYGTDNLRVVCCFSSEKRLFQLIFLCKVDASILPIHISAHTQATLYAVAEKVRPPGFEKLPGFLTRCQSVLGCGYDQGGLEFWFRIYLIYLLSIDGSDPRIKLI
jgi:hypothetical protein